VTAAAAFAAWAGAAVIVLADGRRGLAAGIALIGAGFGALAWLAGALGPLVQNRLDRLMLARIEDLYRESEAHASPQPLEGKSGAAR